MKFKKKLWALMICLSLVLSPMAASATANEPADPQDTIRTSAMTAEEDAESASSTVEAAPEDESSGQEEVIPDDSSQSDPAESEEPENAEDQNSGSDETDLENSDTEEADLEYSDVEEADLPESDPEEENVSGEGVTDDYSESSDSYDTANGSYEYSDPSLESGQNTEETPVEEIVGEVATVGLTAEMAATAVAPTTVWVEATEENGLPVKIDGFKVVTSGRWPRTIFQLYLPGNVDLSKCFLSWDGGSQVTLNNVVYESGTCLLPSPSTVPYTSNNGTAYAFKSGNSTLATFYIIVYQGSPNVEQVFIDIDETQGTIAAMDSDEDHETICKGRICINGTWYDMPQIKGRGNYTWWNSDDKRPYNVSLGKKITFGLDTPSTKKWSFLAEISDHSLLCNRSGYELAHEIGVGQDTTSADVWMNGEYQGCYTVTPKYDSFVPDYGFLIEEDNYKEPEGGDPQFTLEGLNEASGWSSCYNRITVKEMGDGLVSSAGSEADAAEEIRVWLQDAWDAIRSDSGYNDKGKYYTDYIDIESFAKMYLMHEYVKSYDVCAGSQLFHRNGNSDSDKLIAGPIWDLDNALGSTYQNSSLGAADNRRNGDRRSGEGNFIENVNEYKTSIYKTLRKHEDFLAEVTLQYNRHKSSFDNMPGAVQEKIDAISDSAKMNHFKVKDLQGNTVNIHHYDNNTTLGSGEYTQNFLATTNSSTDWPNYAANLKTFVTARSKWFANHYYDPDYVDPATCDHQYEPTVIKQNSCTGTGIISYICPKCKNHYEEETPQLQHDYQNGACTRCGQTLINVTISCPEGASVTVLETQNPEGPSEENAEIVHPRDSDTGWIDCSGDGQVNFIVNVKPGYELESVTAEPSSSYKNFKIVDEAAHIYRYTKVTGDFTISVDVQRTDNIILRSANVEFEGKLQLVFTLNLPDSVKNDAGAYVRFEKNGTTVDIPVSEGIPSGSDTVFELPIKIPEFGDDVTVTVCNGEGNNYSVISESGEDYTEGCTYSVEEYAQNKQEDYSTDEMHDLAVALEDYGKVTQLYFEYGDYEGLDAGPRVPAVTDEELAYFTPTVSGSLPDGVQRATVAVAFNADNTLRITYYLDQDKTAADYEFKLDGTTVTPKERTANSYCVDLENIAAPNLDVPHTFSITGGGGTYSIYCSALTYALLIKDHSDVNVQNLGKALYLYNKAANDFFRTDD